MDSEDYKNIKDFKNVLDYGTLEITLKELNAINQNDLAFEIARIIKNNKIQKPQFHNKPNEQSSDYFIIDLTSDKIELVADHFLNLEVQHVGENGETTPLCAYYASLGDKWNSLND